MNTAKNEAEMAKAPICAPVKARMRNSPSGSIGCLTRASIAMNALEEGDGAAQLGEDRRARPALVVAAQQREHEQEQAGGQREQAGHVDAAGVRVLRLLRRSAG